MSNEQITLKHVFSWKEKVPSEKTLRQIESSEGMSGIKDRVMPQTGKSFWNKVLPEAVNKVDDLLNIKVSDIMVSAWNNYGSLRKYADRKKYPPETTVLFPLVEHTIKSTHKPYVEIWLNESKVGQVNFEIILALTLKALALKIKDGKVMEIKSGSCVGKGTIKCENVQIHKMESKEIQLPGSIPLGDGVEITY